jgi:hypothetical protein
LYSWVAVGGTCRGSQTIKKRRRRKEDYNLKLAPGKSGRHYLKNKSKQKGLEEWFN